MKCSFDARTIPEIVMYQSFKIGKLNDSHNYTEIVLRRGVSFAPPPTPLKLVLLYVNFSNILTVEISTLDKKMKLHLSRLAYDSLSCICYSETTCIKLQKTFDFISSQVKLSNSFIKCQRKKCLSSLT